MNRGYLVVISSPSGGGKTSIIQYILRKYPDQYVYSISATTREKRPGEIEGTDYFFLTEKQFSDYIAKNLLLEWEEVHGYLYGTPRDYIEKCIDEGKFVLIDIDVNGALEVARRFPDKTITIFVLPPSVDELIRRLKNRKTDSVEEIDKRVQRIPMEIKKSKQFDYIVINYQLEKTAEQVVNIINNHLEKMNNSV